MVVLLEKLMQFKRDLLNIAGIENVELVLVDDKKVRGELFLSEAWLRDNELRSVLESKVEELIQRYNKFFEIIDLRLSILVR